MSAPTASTVWKPTWLLVTRSKKPKGKSWLFLIDAKEEGKRLVGYGTPAKGNTLLNYCGIRSDFLDYTVDREPP